MRLPAALLAVATAGIDAEQLAGQFPFAQHVTRLQGTMQAERQARARGPGVAGGACVGVVTDASCVRNVTMARGLHDALSAAGLCTREVSAAGLADPAVVNASALAALVLPDAPLLPPAAAPNYLRYALAGGSLALLGGRPARLNVTRAQAAINALSPYEPYHLSGVAATRSVAGALREAVEVAGPLTGLSAVGFAFPGESAFAPAVEAYDQYNRTAGWALGVQTHHAGPFAGGTWVLSGVREARWYAAPAFARALAELLTAPAAPAATPAAAAPRRAAVPAKGGFVRRSADGRHLVYEDGSRYFMLGADYFRGMHSNALDAPEVEEMLSHAAAAGLNTVRVYGFSAALAARADVVALFRRYLSEHGIRVLFTLPAYKDAAQTTKESVVARTVEDTRPLANETWLLGYDLANEIDDRGGFPGSLVGDGGQTLLDKYPNAKRWGDYVQWQCGGWSTTFDPAHCGAIDAALRSRIPAALQPVFDDASGMLAEWVGWRVGAIRGGAGDARHLITLGNNALHSLLPGNAGLDFVSHHSYAGTGPAAGLNTSCTKDSEYNVTAVKDTLSLLAALWADDPRPVTFGEFGSRTTHGLWELYTPALATAPAAAAADAWWCRAARTPQGRWGLHTPAPAAAAAPAGARRAAGCALGADCLSGIASTIGWYLGHGSECDAAWQHAVADNAGPGSAHHRCPAAAVTEWGACEAGIEAAGRAGGFSTCNWTAGPRCDALSLQASAQWDLASWLHALASGYDGALRWALFEQPYPTAYKTTTWQGDDWDPTSHDAYVSGGRWGFFWYDGTPAGAPKPVAHATRFLSAYLSRAAGALAAPGRYALTFAGEPAAAGLGASWVFAGPDCLFVGNATRAAPGTSLEYAAGGADAAVVMLAWDEPAALRVMATADAAVTLRPRLPPVSASWGAAGATVAGRHGGVSRDGDALTVTALAGEELTVAPAGPATLRARR